MSQDRPPMTNNQTILVAFCKWLHYNSIYPATLHTIDNFTAPKTIILKEMDKTFSELSDLFLKDPNGQQMISYWADVAEKYNKDVKS